MREEASPKRDSLRDALYCLREKDTVWIEEDVAACHKDGDSELLSLRQNYPSTSRATTQVAQAAS